MTWEEILSFLQKEKTNLKINDYFKEEKQTMIFRDRDYPDGDDTCKMILPCVLNFKKGNKTFVVTKDGRIFSFTESSRTDRYIYGKYEKEISLSDI